METSSPNYLHHRAREAPQPPPRSDEPGTSAARKAGCEVHKSGFVRGAPEQSGASTRPPPLRDVSRTGHPIHKKSESVNAPGPLSERHWGVHSTVSAAEGARLSDEQNVETSLQ